MEEKIQDWKARLLEICSEMQVEQIGKNMDAHISSRVTGASEFVDSAVEYLDAALGKSTEGQTND